MGSIGHAIRGFVCFGAVALLALVSAMPASAAAGPSAPSPGYNAGSAPTGAEQSAAWTQAQAQTYANKLQAVAIFERQLGSPVDAPYIPLGLPQANVLASPSTVVPSSASIPGVLNNAEPNSSYGYQCGPAAGHNALGGFGVNYPIGTGSYPNATYLTQEMHTTTSAGTGRTYMPSALNAHQSRNTYVWQNLGGASDVSFYTTLDISYQDAPLYNIETYGYNPLDGKYEYPFSPQWTWDIRHFIAAYAYQSTGNYISISDSAVQGSYTAAQRYTKYYVNIWVAINDIHQSLGLANQILW